MNVNENRFLAKIREKRTDDKKQLIQEQRDIINELFEDVIENKTFDNQTKNTHQEKIRFSKIKAFEENPFKTYDDEKLNELAESIQEDGLLHPILLWKQEDTYTILSGHNRFLALEKLGHTELEPSMYKIFENISENEAKLIVTDANLYQRQSLLPSERAKAYKIQKEILTNNTTTNNKYSSKRTEIFEFFSEENALNTVEILEFEKNSTEWNLQKTSNIYNYLRLNYLIEKLLNKVDEREISIKIGVELSYLKPEEQKEVLEFFFGENSNKKLNLDIAKKTKEKAKNTAINRDVLELIVESLEKPKNKRTFKLNFKEIRSLATKELKTDKDAKEYIIECVKFYEENNIDRSDEY